MLVSQALKLNQAQPMLDFVDIDLDHDFPLYIDPIGFAKPQDEFAKRCQNDIQDFFGAVLKTIMQNKSTDTETLLAALQEPNEIHLGVSKGEPDGRGIGKGQAKKIADSIRNSPAAKSGLIKDLNDCVLFIDNIGPDKISDMTANIIRRHLIDYTKEQFEYHHIPIDTNLPTGRLWETGQGKWDNKSFDQIPLINGRKVLLVPKRYVVWKGGGYNLPSRYYHHFMTNFIRDEQLRTNGNLVQVITTSTGAKKRKVFKKDIKVDYPNKKPIMAEFSVKHPDVYKKFKSAISRHNPIGLKTILEQTGGQFNETKFGKATIDSLLAVPTGRKASSDYQHLVCGIITYCFFSDLTMPVLEQVINDGRKRIDVMFANSSNEGFLKDRKDDPFAVAREVMVECKNYAEDLANNEVDQLLGRFDPKRGRFGIIACRSVDNLKRLTDRCRDGFNQQNGIVLAMTDADFIELLSANHLNRQEIRNSMLRQKFRAISL